MREEKGKGRNNKENGEKKMRKEEGRNESNSELVLKSDLTVLVLYKD